MIDYRLLWASSFIFYPSFMFFLPHPTQMVTCYIAVAYRPLSYVPSSVSVCNTLFWRRKKTRPLGTKFHRKFSIDGPVSTKLMLFFFIGNAQQKHEALIKGCLLFLCMQHLLFNWCWWFYLSVHFIQSSLRTVHYLPVGMDRCYILIFPPRKNEYILVFPPERSVYTHFFPRKDQYILIFPPDF